MTNDERAVTIADAQYGNWRGDGWYYWDREYPEEGSCGPFDSLVELKGHAVEGGYTVEIV